MDRTFGLYQRVPSTHPTTPAPLPSATQGPAEEPTSPLLSRSWRALSASLTNPQWGWRWPIDPGSVFKMILHYDCHHHHPTQQLLCIWVWQLSKPLQHPCPPLSSTMVGLLWTVVPCCSVFIVHISSSALWKPKITPFHGFLAEQREGLLIVLYSCTLAHVILC